jgi:hypothetical protein
MAEPPHHGHADLFVTVAIGAPEARWFVPGATRLPCRQADRWRTDRYHTRTLSPERSLKRRGVSGTCEMKVRLLPPEPVEIGAVSGRLEHWCKIAGPDLEANTVSSDDEWEEVEKLIWRDEDDRVEFVALTALGRRWWSVSVRSYAGRPTRLPPALERKLVGASEVREMSYPAWLVSMLASP